MDPLEIGKQEWKNMRLVSLDLSSLDLTNIPMDFCHIYSNLSMLDLSNNAICPPYPKCVEYVDFHPLTLSLCGYSHAAISVLVHVCMLHQQECNARICGPLAPDDRVVVIRTTQ